MKDMILYPLNLFVQFFEHIGKYFDLMSKMFRSIRSWSLYLGLVPEHMISLGIATFPIVFVTGLFSGMVIAVNTSYQLDSGFIPESYVGGVVGVTILMELAPMITALVMTGKIGATISAGGKAAFIQWYMGGKIFPLYLA